MDRVCTKCKEIKSLTECYRLIDQSKIGKGSYYDSACKECRNASFRARYRKMKKDGGEKFEAWFRNSENSSKFKMDYSKRNPDKRRAQARVCTAIKNGTLERPNSCEVCLKDCKPEAHHSDYRKPLEVHWLCTSCHGRVHSALNYVRRYFGVEAHHILPEVIYGT